MIQKQALANQFYPANPNQIKSAMAGLFDGNEDYYFPTAPRAIIVPHSGFRFSGPIAAPAMREIHHEINRVVIISPSHRMDFEGIARPTYDYFRTPIGQLEVSPRAKRFTLKLDFVHDNQEAFEKEQGVELILPWVKRIAPKATIAPFVVGRAKVKQVEMLLRRLWGNTKTLIVISTDLGHFKDLETIQKGNQRTAVSIETGQTEQITAEDACGWLGLRAFLNIAKEQGMRVERMALGDSHQANSDPENVVGYGSWVVHNASDFQLPESEKSELYHAIASSIWKKLNGEPVSMRAYDEQNQILNSYWPSFLKLTVGKSERRAIGVLQPRASMYKQTLQLADKVAFDYQGAEPITLDNFSELECEIEVLSLVQELKYESRADLEAKLEETKPGVILTHQNNRTNFLPEKWRDFLSAADFLDAILERHNLPNGHWEDGIRINTYYTESLGNARLKDYLSAT